jgi:hypothetical protein
LPQPEAGAYQNEWQLIFQSIAIQLYNIIEYLILPQSKLITFKILV